MNVSTVFVLALLGWLALKRWRPGWRWPRRGVLVVVALTAILIYPFTNNLLAIWLETELAPDLPCRAVAPAAIAVLPAGLRRQPQGSGTWSRLSPTTAVRLLEAVALARRHPDARLLLAGRKWEARLMVRALAELGAIDPGRIVTDNDAPSTGAAARQVAGLLAAQGLDSAWLVTSALHMPRAQLAFERQGIAVCPFPVDYTAQRWPRPWWIFPPPQGLERADRLAHELLGLAWYWATDKI